MRSLDGGGDFLQVDFVIAGEVLPAPAGSVLGGNLIEADLRLPGHAVRDQDLAPAQSRLRVLRAERVDHDAELARDVADDDPIAFGLSQDAIDRRRAVGQRRRLGAGDHRHGEHETHDDRET